MPSDAAMPFAHDGRAAFAIKRVASVLQIAGYTATGFDWTPWNACLIFGGVAGWLTVGVLWNDRALMLIHAVALVAMFAGLSSR